ncbi:monosaccharide ABC transporter substrate-binding protein, CUT2 family [Salinihabitans flavidus]|uniref:Monosaccharide ABC transporter substrate-binding protein, CUT2 family n=1 Tax=Salinihabitans flavidus TaxID=569882 RepID=A0A1H8PB89_9RHOB|nr:substrate-binding domain-containing protein [Salinihabitans flavidus]SEO39086.1 monosaccharide ABC transporter substrate-binding protein, CUT2 family [Salinihabitans flavidus]
MVNSKLKLAGAVASAALTIGGAAMGEETPSWCGPDEATLALMDGFGGNSWRQVTNAAAAIEAAKCPSITNYEYSDAQGNTQKAISDIKAFTAKGTDALIVFADSGPAVLPAMTSAYRAGRVVIPFRVEVAGEEGVNFSKYLNTDFYGEGVTFANWIKEILPDGGNVLFLSGPAGTSQGVQAYEGMKSVLGDEYVFLNSLPFAVTNWDPALTQQVLTAEIAKHDEIDVIVSDFGPSLVGALPEFEKYGRSIPAIAAADGNSIGCFWHEKHESNPDFELFTVSTGNDDVRLAVQWAAALATGGTPPEQEMNPVPPFENSITGEPNPVQCRDDLPGSIFLSSSVPADVQAKAVGGK